MHIKEWFTVPEGMKVTETMFGKVLLSSICGILLCMACLAGTTWAWFVVDIENSGNEIQLAAVTADVTVTQAGAQRGETADGSYILEENTYAVNVKIYNQAKNPVYLVMTVTQNGTTQCYSVPCANGSTDVTKQLQITGTPATVSFGTKWTVPPEAIPFDSEVVVTDLPALAPTA